MKFDWSVKKQMLAPKKIYFVDNAIIGKVGFNATDNIGQLLENIVYIQLKRKNQEIYYHDNGIECDFIVRQGINITHAFQVTRSLTDPQTKQREINGLLSALQTYHLKEGTILTEDENGELEVEGHKINIYPIWKWLLL